MKVSIAIMADRRRAKEAHALCDAVLDMPFCGVNLVFDNGGGEWDTGKRSLQEGIGQGDWHVVIQDDALLTPYFYENVLGAITAMPERSLLSLYTGAARPIPDRVKSAVDKSPDGSWLRFHQLLWGVGIAIPTDHIEPMLEFVEDIELQYDNKVGEFYARQGVTVYYTVPSLVDHDDSLDTLVPGHGRDISLEPRVAHRLATEVISWGNQKTPI